MGESISQLLPRIRPSDLHQIHATALTILERVGVRVEEPGFRRRLKALGAEVQSESGVVRLDRALVEAALRSIPRRFVLCDRAGGSFVVGDGSNHVALPGGVPRVLDYGASQPRPATPQDLVDFTRVGDALPTVELMRPMVEPHGVDGGSGSLSTLQTFLTNTIKHVLLFAFDFAEFRLWVDLLERLAAPDGLAARPLMTAAITSTSPLRLIADHTKMLELACASRLPIAALSTVSVGGTGPGTLAGSLAVQHAENLFVIAIAQMITPGIPCCYCSTTSPMDMRVARITRGGPLQALLTVGSAGLARLCGLPSYTTGFQTDSSRVDAQAGMQKSLMLMVAREAGVSICAGLGVLAAATLVSLEQAALDAELYAALNQYLNGLAVDEQRIGFSTIEVVGPGGNFLGEEHTVRWLRDLHEHFQPEVFVTSTISDGGDGALERAHQRVTDILSSYRPRVSLEETELIQQFCQERAAPKS